MFGVSVTKCVYAKTNIKPIYNMQMFVHMTWPVAFESLTDYLLNGSKKEVGVYNQNQQASSDVRIAWTDSTSELGQGADRIRTQAFVCEWNVWSEANNNYNNTVVCVCKPSKSTK